ncbi:MAG: c-type cytochrome [Saprospiraceae bacterium]
MIRIIICLLPLFIISWLGFWQGNPSKHNLPATASNVDTTFDMQKALATLREQIKGKENLPADSVFQNIQVLKKVPAACLLRIMENGYSTSLGVTCTHCHMPDEWAKEDKPQKQITREMAAMMREINNDLLKKIPNLPNKTPVINCTTCHRGQVKPALDLQQKN